MDDVKNLPRLLRNLAGYKTTRGATSSEAGMLNTAADEIDALRQQVKILLEQQDRLISTIDKEAEQLAIAIEALDKLSKLGNEPFVGNSIGNDIAVKALTKIRGE
jgi:hypothetical protein